MKMRGNKEDGFKAANDTGRETVQLNDGEGRHVTELDHSNSLSTVTSATNCIQESSESSRNNFNEEHNDNEGRYSLVCTHESGLGSTIQSRHDYIEPRRDWEDSDIYQNFFSNCKLVEDLENSNGIQQCVQETCVLDRLPVNVSGNRALQEIDNSSTHLFHSIDGLLQQAPTTSEHLCESDMKQSQRICEYLKESDSDGKPEIEWCTDCLHCICSALCQTEGDTKCVNELCLDIKSSSGVYCSVSKCCHTKKYWKLILKYYPYQTEIQSNISTDKNTKYSDHDLDRDTLIKGSLRKLITPIEQDLIYDNLIYTVFPVSSTPVSSEQQSNISGFEPLLTVINTIAEGERVPPQISMRYEMLRFCTLRSFPKENKPFITRIAAAGFYYANSGDELVCYCCAKRKSNWTDSDNPMEIHRQMNPNCSFLTRNSEVNIPIRLVTESSSAAFISSTRSSTNGTHLEHSSRSSSQNNVEVVSTSHTDVHLDAAESSVASTTSGTTSRTGSQAQVSDISTRMAVSSVSSPRRTNQSVSVLSVDVPGARSERRATYSSSGDMNQTDSPKYPKYFSKVVRLTSFGDCGDIVITPENLAEAGFFYAGFGDCVRCFQCGVGLRHWSEDDDPWIEHSRWSKDCSYVRQMKGQEFVNLVQMAVQYSQNQSGGNLPLQHTRGAAGGQSDADPERTDRLMHTDAAQSVLEMGYLPDVIRRAIRMIVSSAGDLTAANIMEKIFEIEDSETHQNTIPDDTETSEGCLHDESSSRTSTAIAGNTTEEASASINSQPEDNSGATGSYTGAVNKENNMRPDDKSETAVLKEDECTSGNQDRGTDQSMNTKSRPLGMAATARKAHLMEQKRLKEENKKLKQQSICTKCNTNEVCIVFLPCGHLVTCEECAPTVRYCTMDTCGKYIKGTVRTYLA